jgi:hypothetical protein
MKFPILLALAAGLPAAALAAAPVSTDQYRKLPECRLSADGKHLLVEPCRTAPPRPTLR